MPKNLNLLYRYSKIRSFRFENSQKLILKANPISSKDDWYKRCFYDLKTKIKKNYLKSQKDRCAYCRKIVTADGYHEPIDHIAPRALYKKWTFKVKNMAVSCTACNSNKSDEDTISGNQDKRKFPKYKTGFIFFNPHFHIWSDHLRIEDGIFFKAIDEIGEETIRICKLFQYHYTVNNVIESACRFDSAIRKATTRITRFPPDSEEYKAAMKFIKYYEERI